MNRKRSQAQKSLCTLVYVVLFVFGIFAFSQSHSLPNQDSLAMIEKAIQTGNHDQAIQLSHAALEKSPRDYRLWTLRAMAFVEIKKPALALTDYKHALRLRPDYIPALEGAAQIEYLENSSTAKPLLEQLLALDPANPTAHAMLAVMDARARDCTEAVGHFKKASTAIASQTSALTLYAYCLVNMDRFEDAIPVLQSIATLDPNVTVAHYNLALAQWNAGHPNAAFETLEPMIQSGVTDEEILTLAADIEESVHNTSSAVELLRKAILANPAKIEAYLHFATLSSSHRSYKVGIDILSAGLTQMPNESRLYLARGILYAELGSMPEAMDNFANADRCDPSLSFLGTAEGVAETQMYKFTDAIAKFRAQVKKNPNDALSQYLLAEALSHERKLEDRSESQQAIEAAKHALKIDPQLMGARNLLTGLYLQSGKTDAAIEQCEIALKTRPDDQEALYHLILALRTTDRKSEIPALTKRLIALRQADRTGSPRMSYRLVEVPGGTDSSNTAAISPGNP